MGNISILPVMQSLPRARIGNLHLFAVDVHKFDKPQLHTEFMSESRAQFCSVLAVEVIHY